MIEMYLEWKAAIFFGVIAIAIGITGIYISWKILAWIYKKICDSREKRINKMMDNYFKEDGDSDDST